MTWRSAAALAVGCLALVWIISSVGAGVMARDVAAAGWVLPETVCIYLVQLFLSAQAWRACLGRPLVASTRIFRLRWIREGINALLPVAQIGGQVVGAQLLARQGMRPALAAAGTILDLTLEAAAQVLFTLAGMAVLLATRRNDAWLSWMGGGLALTAASVTGLIVLQRVGGLRLVEAVMARLAKYWPGTAAWSLGGLHRILMARQSDHGALLRATALHTTAWALGGAEVWVVLGALGSGVSVLDAVVIESLGMAARSAGFAVPGAVGVQEGGLVLVCGLFGVPAEAALALSVLKRVREALVGVPALVAWQRAEAVQPQLVADE
jgi:putative membrane protein